MANFCTALFLLVLLAGWPAPCQAKSELFLAVAPLAPWQWMRGGEVHGPDAAILAELARRLEFTPRWTPMANATDFSPLLDGRAELVAGVADADRRPYLACFPKPLRVQERLVAHVRKGAEHFLRREEDLMNFAVGLAEGVRLPQVEEGHPRPVMRGALADLLPALASGRLDALLAPAAAWERTTIPPQVAAQIVPAPLVVDPLPLFVCLAKDADLMARFAEMETHLGQMLE